jgi:hypothetical protein
MAVPHRRQAVRESGPHRRFAKYQSSGSKTIDLESTHFEPPVSRQELSGTGDDRDRTGNP